MNRQEIYEPMQCDYFTSGQCDSCRRLDRPYAEQLQAKEAELKKLLAPFEPLTWCEPVPSPQAGFRNKAKMAVIGTAKGIVTGLINKNGEAVSLAGCPLYPEEMQKLLAAVEAWIAQAGLSPYRVDKKRGEVKFVLLTRSTLGEYMLRFVLRSKAQMEKITKALPSLLDAFPAIKVVSVNIQPIHMAVLEGEEEIFLSEATSLEERFNGIPLHIRPKSFFQTNPVVAEALYAQARSWAGEADAKSVWDLFCGVGGFGLHCSDSNTDLTGIEIEPEAIRCAKMSAEAIGLESVRFEALDADTFAGQSDTLPDLLIVNPPRRGIGAKLAERVNRFGPPTILYSSCNAKSLAADLMHLTGYRLEKVRLFDMFPHTAHYEVLVMMKKSLTP